MEEKTNLQQFLENFKEKKTTVMGIVTMIISLLAMFFPKIFVDVPAEEATEIVANGYDLIASVITFVSGLLLTISSMFKKKE